VRDGGIRERRLDLAVVGVGLCLGLLLGWPLAAATAGASPPEVDLVFGRSTREVAAIAAEVTGPAVRRRPASIASEVLNPWSCASRIRLRMNTW